MWLDNDLLGIETALRDLNSELEGVPPRRRKGERWQELQEERSRLTNRLIQLRAERDERDIVQGLSPEDCELIHRLVESRSLRWLWIWWDRCNNPRTRRAVGDAIDHLEALRMTEEKIHVKA